MRDNGILASYSPEDVSVIISNDEFTHRISGYVEGSFINISRVVPHATLYTGGDASNVRVVRDVRNYDISLTLHNAADSHDVLSRLMRLDTQSRDGRHLFSLTIKDEIGRTVGSAATAFIGTHPDVEFSTEVSDREWILHAVGYDLHIGGNRKLDSNTWGTLVNLGEDIDPFWKF